MGGGLRAFAIVGLHGLVAGAKGPAADGALALGRARPVFTPLFGIAAEVVEAVGIGGKAAHRRGERVCIAIAHEDGETAPDGFIDRFYPTIVASIARQSKTQGYYDARLGSSLAARADEDGPGWPRRLRFADGGAGRRDESRRRRVRHKARRGLPCWGGVATNFCSAEQPPFFPNA